MAEYLGSLFGGEKEQAPAVASDDGMFSYLINSVFISICGFFHRCIQSGINSFYPPKSSLIS